MTYTKQTWVDGQPGGTPLSAERLNHMEDGIAAVASSGAGLPSTIVTKTANYTAAAGEFVQANTTGGGFTVTLPAAPAAGTLVAVKKTSSDTNTLTIVASASGTIDGDATATTNTKGGGAVFEHVGSNVWQIAAVTLSTGPAGPTGGTGPQGPTGATGPTGPAGAISQLQDEGSNLTVRNTINFTGPAVTATDDAPNGRTNVAVNASFGSSVFGFPLSIPIPTTLAAASLNGRIYLARVWGSGTITKIRINVTTQSGNICVGVYAGGTSGIASAQPGALKGTSGSVACPAAGVQDITLTGSVVVNEGDWIAIMADNSTAQFSANGLGSAQTQWQGMSGFQASAGTTLPLPSSATVSSWENKVFWMVGVA